MAGEYDQQHIEHELSNSDRDENIILSDQLNVSSKQTMYSSENDLHQSIQFEDNIFDKINNLNDDRDTNEKKVYVKEIEWWNEITPWKNGESFYARLREEKKANSITYENTDADSNSKIKRKKKLERSVTCRSYSGQCPLTFDGAFGLIQAYHQHQLCIPTKNLNKKICLYQHFHSKHGFTGEISTRLVKAVIHQQDPYETKLFSSTKDTPLTLYDPFHKVKCPLSTRHDIINTPCLTQEITRKSIRRHLLGVHRLDQETINKLIKEMIK